MQKYLVFAYLVGSLAACRNDPATNKDGGVDMAVPAGADLSVTTDMARNYIAATPHDIDTSGPTGPFSANKPVALTDVIVTSDVRYFLSKSKTICSYEAYVQDPACNTPPCGLVIQVDGPMASSTSPVCPDASASNTVLAPVKLKDKLSVKGFVNVFQMNLAVDGGTTGSLTQHAVENLSGLSVTASNQALPAGVAVDSALFADISASGWATYESTRVTFSNVTVSVLVGAFGAFRTTPGNLSWGGDYDNNYRFMFGGDAGVYPTQGQHFTSLTGIVSSFPLAYGKLYPVVPADFVP